MPAGFFPPLRRQLSLILLGILICPGLAWADWQRLYCESPAFSIEAPPGWTLQPVDGRGARLLSPNGVTVVEVVFWRAYRPPATAETALAEHEAVLARKLDYRRDEVTEIVTDDERTGLLISGRVRTDGITNASIFSAFGDDTNHVVVGTFASPDRIDRLREDLLEPMMRSFRFEAPGIPSPAPVPLPGPDTTHPEPAERPGLEPTPPGEMQQGRAPMTIGVGPREQPIGPTDPAPEIAWIEHLNPRGFSISIPVDWEVAVDTGGIIVTPAVPGEGREALLIAPLLGPDPGGRQALGQVIAALPEIDLSRLQTTTRDGVTFIDGSARGGLRLSATWVHEDNRGLLIAALASRAAWNEQFPRMSRMAASFQASAWEVPPQPSRAELVQGVSAEAAGLILRIPDGWEVSGGFEDDAGELLIDLEARENVDDGIFIRWRQPLRPRLRDLTPLLESLGWREGERYSVPERESGLLIYSHRDPAEMVRDIMLPRHPQQLEQVIVEALPLDDFAAALLPGAEAAGQIVRIDAAAPGGMREMLWVAATARAEAPLTATCWEAAALLADAPEGRLDEAVAALATIVRTAEPADHITGRLRERLSSLTDRARQALQSLPEESADPPAAVMTVVFDVENGGDGDLWETPRGALDFWNGASTPDYGGRPPVGAE